MDGWIYAYVRIYTHFMYKVMREPDYFMKYMS